MNNLRGKPTDFQNLNELRRYCQSIRDSYMSAYREVDLLAELTAKALELPEDQEKGKGNDSETI